MTSPRADLMALTEDDLVALSNRGNLNRARRDLESDAFHVEFRTDTENTLAVWSDPVTCVFPNDRTVAQAYCTCPSGKICRHLVRSILAYQALHAHPETQAATAGPWNPGELSDATLDAAFGPLMKRAHALLDTPLVAQALIGHKPLVQFLTLGHTVRFLVPGDPRYAHCDCAAQPPCLHGAAAALVFRRLPRGAAGGIVTTDDESPRHHPTAASAAEWIGRMARIGLARTSRASGDRLRGHAESLVATGWVWPGDVAEALANARELYQAHDARFSPGDVARLAGEFLARVDALAAPDLPVPRVLVQGGQADIDTRLGQSRFVGLGVTARIHRGYVDLMALMQDADHGRVVAVAHRFADERTDEPVALSTLGSRLVLRGRSVAHFGHGQIVMKQARLTHTHRLDPSGANASVYAQNFKWEELAAPTLAQDFGEVVERLANLPPACLRSRRVGEDVCVVPIARVEGARFDVRSQSVVAQLFDVAGGAAVLRFPYLARTHEGCERLLKWLTQTQTALRFVAGTARLAAQGIEIEPSGVVFETPGPDGLRRAMVQPWVDSLDAHLEAPDAPIARHEPHRNAMDWLRESLDEQLGTLLVQGIDEFRGWEAMTALCATARALGLMTVAAAVDDLISERDEASVMTCLVTNVVFQETQ